MALLGALLVAGLAARLAVAVITRRARYQPRRLSGAEAQARRDALRYGRRTLAALRRTLSLADPIHQAYHEWVAIQSARQAWHAAALTVPEDPCLTC